jgi:hypothetical protein
MQDQRKATDASPCWANFPVCKESVVEAQSMYFGFALATVWSSHSFPFLTHQVILDEDQKGSMFGPSTGTLKGIQGCFSFLGVDCYISHD